MKLKLMLSFLQPVESGMGRQDWHDVTGYGTQLQRLLWFSTALDMLEDGVKGKDRSES